MPDLTREQTDELANQALELKKAVGAFRNTFFNDLTQDQRDGLQALANELGDEVDHLTAVAIRLSLDELQETFAHLRDVTAGVKDAAAHLRNVGKVLTVATSLIGLGTAIASGEPVEVVSALNDTAAAVKG